MIRFLLDNPLVLLFAVVGAGYLLGRVRVAGTSLGVAAVLFAGLAFGALDPELKLPAIVYELGLVLFVYAVGLSSGPGFVAAFRRRGLTICLWASGLLALAGLLVYAAHVLLGLSPALAAGMFTGSMTNTPALAGVIEYLKTATPPGAAATILDEPVVAYSIAYPVGTVGVILTIAIARRVWRIDFAEDAKRAAGFAGSGAAIKSRTIEVTRDEATTAPLSEVIARHGWDVLFGRVKRGNEVSLVDVSRPLAVGDLVTAIGPPPELDRATEALGAPSEERIELDRSRLDYRRIFVSDPRVAGLRLRDLNLPQQFGAMVTRIRRGDVELVPSGGTVLELGDRVRVLTRRENLPAIARFFGDSYRAVSEIDVLTFSLGLTLGLLLGAITFPLPGGLGLKLGLAGGPLVVGLVLGTLARTGPLVWTLPYGVNLTLRQLGLVLFFAGVGTRSGYAFVSTLGEGPGLAILAAGAVVTVATYAVAIWVGYRLLGHPFGVVIGALAGLQTQPAVLAFALDEAGNELPNVGYAAVFPVATIMKIVIAQLLLVAML